MLRKTNTPALCASVVASALLTTIMLVDVTPASAQDALGDGRVLDGNLSTEGNINQRARQEDYRVRNLLVTDNVPGGRGFRGSVGYGAENDFRGSLGSDDFYQFRADSAFSAPSFINYGRTYEQLRFGNQLASLEFSRDFQGSSLRQINEPLEPAPGALIDARVRLDRISRSSQGLGVYESEPGGDTIGYMYDKDGKLLVARASALQGIEYTPADGDAQMIGLTPYDMARLREQTKKTGTEGVTVGAPFTPKFSDVIDPYRSEEPTTLDKPKPESFRPGEKVDERINSSIPSERIESREGTTKLDAGQQSSYRDVLKRVVERYAGQDNVTLNIDPALIKEFEQDYDQLRKTLQGRPTGYIVPRDEPGETTGDEEETAPATTNNTGITPSTDLVPTPPGASATPDLSNTTDIDRLAATLRHGQHIDRLASSDDTRFNELVATAEKALREGEFFLAERRFDRALRFSPGNPLATAGMGHAQIGSGLNLSAALTIRTLLTNNPEMIDVVYDKALVPARNRLESALTTARASIKDDHDVALNTFLVAYLGRLMDDKGLIVEGLDGLAKASPNDPLQKLLRAVWLPSDKAADEPQK